jgi:hypothetical protein
MDRDTAVKQIGTIRAVVGAAAWIAPRPFGKAFGLDSDANPQAPYIGRLFGVRDVALAYGVLSTDGESRERWIKAGIGCDMADAVAGIAAWRAGYLSALSSVLVTVPALHGVSLGLAALRGGSGDTSVPVPAA